MRQRKAEYSRGVIPAVIVSASSNSESSHASRTRLPLASLERSITDRHRAGGGLKSCSHASIAVCLVPTAEASSPFSSSAVAMRS